MQLFLVLLAGHFLSDFPLQPNWMLEEKFKFGKTELGTLSLFAHAYIQAFVLGGMAYYLGFNGWQFAWIVGVTHFFIDLGKIRGLYGVWVDQILHFAIIILCITLL